MIREQTVRKGSFQIVTASCDQQIFDNLSKIRSKLTWHPNMILAKYLSAESVERRQKKPPREIEHDECVQTQKKTARIGKTTVFVCRNQGLADLNRKTA